MACDPSTTASMQVALDRLNYAIAAGHTETRYRELSRLRFGKATPPPDR
jgi:hypothetical protein